MFSAATSYQAQLRSEQAETDLVIKLFTLRYVCSSWLVYSPLCLVQISLFQYFGVLAQLAPYPEVKKLVAEGDVSYSDALEMVGLKKPVGGGAFGFGPDVQIEDIQEEETPKKKRSAIRSAGVKRRKHAGDSFIRLINALSLEP